MAQLPGWRNVALRFSCKSRILKASSEKLLQSRTGTLVPLESLLNHYEELAYGNHRLFVLSAGSRMGYLALNRIVAFVTCLCIWANHCHRCTVPTVSVQTLKSRGFYQCLLHLAQPQNHFKLCRNLTANAVARNNLLMSPCLLWWNTHDKAGILALTTSPVQCFGLLLRLISSK